MMRESVISRRSRITFQGKHNSIVKIYIMAFIVYIKRISKNRKKYLNLCIFIKLIIQTTNM